MLNIPFIAPDDWKLPSGFSPGVRTTQGYRARLAQAIQAAKSDPFITWGWHQLFHGPLGRAGVKLSIKPTTLELPLDQERALRVLQNLVTNASEAIAKRPGGRITVAARRVKSQCVITVADNGPGVPREIRSTLFEPFVSQGKVNGTGLGLAIAKAVVEAHHGVIDFKSSRAGTTFSVHLPM